MRFRRSRCIYITIVIILLHVIILSILRNGSNSIILLPAKLKDFHYDFSNPSILFRPKDAYSFNAWADKMFDKNIRQVNSGAVKMAQFAIEPAVKRVKDSVTLPKYLKGKGENPHLVPFDPRLTLGLYLNDINAKLHENSGNAEKLEIETFHWSDWTDLSILYSHALSAGNDRFRCSNLNSQDVGRRPKDPELLSPEQFCYDDDIIPQIANDSATNANLKANLDHILKSPHRLGFHVFRHPGRSSAKNMKLSGASYLNDFMNAPLSILFLMPTKSQKYASLKVSVKQDVLSRVKIIDSPLASAVAEREKTVLVGKEVKRTLELLKVDNESPFSPTKELAATSFYDPLKQIIQELANNYELTPQEKNYFESLALSLNVERVPKYFYEAKLIKSTRNWALGGHYDWRFFKGLINLTDLQLPVLHGLLLAWLRFTSANELTTWVAHGSLLSWYWNGMTFPWDADIDVQMPVVDLHKLARNFNQTIVVDFGPDVQNNVRYGRYFVDCGTWISHRQTENGLNFIDARFVDLDSGLYIDITGLALSNTMAPERYDKNLPQLLIRSDPFEVQNKINRERGKPIFRVPDDREVERNLLLKVFNCRNNHFQSLDELSPLKLTYVDGVPAYVPNDFVSMLQAEYGVSSTGAIKHRNYAFFPRIRLWQDIRSVRRHINGAQSESSKVDLGADTIAAKENVDKVSEFSFSDQDYIQLMASEPQLLVDYLVSRDVTSLHEREMDALLNGKSTEKLLLEDGKLKYSFQPIRHDLTNYKHHKYNFDFEEEVKNLDEQLATFRAGLKVLSEKLEIFDVDKPQPEVINRGR